MSGTSSGAGHGGRGGKGGPDARGKTPDADAEPETPPQADVYKTYLTKLSDQEKEIDALTAKQKKLMADEFAAKKAYEDFLANLSD